MFSSPSNKQGPLGDDIISKGLMFQLGGPLLCSGNLTQFLHTPPMGKNGMWGSPEAPSSNRIERQRSPPAPHIPQVIRPSTERTAFGNITNTYQNQQNSSFGAIKSSNLGGHAFVSSNSFKQLMVQPDMLNEYESPSNLLKYCSKMSANKFGSAIAEHKEDMGGNRVQVSPFFAKNSNEENL